MPADPAATPWPITLGYTLVVLSLTLAVVVGLATGSYLWGIATLGAAGILMLASVAVGAAVGGIVYGLPAAFRSRSPRGDTGRAVSGADSGGGH